METNELSVLEMKRILSEKGIFCESDILVHINGRIEFDQFLRASLAQQPAPRDTSIVPTKVVRRPIIRR